MKISDKLVIFNVNCFVEFSVLFIDDNVCQVLFVFNGDVYIGFDVQSLSDDDIVYVQQYLWIFLGLYGVL